MKFSKIDIEYYREEFDKKLMQEDRRKNKKVKKLKEKNSKDQLSLF